MVAAGTAIAQLVTIGFYPAITRIYGPEAFGVLGGFLSVVSVLTPIAGFTFPLAIVLPKSDGDAMGLVRLSLLVGGMTALLTGLLMLLAGEPIGRLLGLEQLPGLVAILPATVLVLTAQQAAQQWLIRAKRFGLTAKITVFQSLMVNVTKVGVGLLLPNAIALVIVTLAGLASHAAALWLGVRRRAPSGPPLENVATPLATLANRYRDFPIYRAPQDLLNALSQGLPIILLSMFYGPAVAGLFVLARSVLGAPLELIGNSIGTVLYPRLAEAANRDEKLWRLVAIPTGMLLALGAVPFGAILAFGPTIFDFFFGPEWYEAGEYARWMTLWIMLMFANIPSVRIIPVLRMQRFHLIFGLIVLFARLAAIVAGYLLYSNPLYSVLLYSVCGAALNFILICFVLQKTWEYDLSTNNLKNAPETPRA